MNDKSRKKTKEDEESSGGKAGKLISFALARKLSFHRNESGEGIVSFVKGKTHQCWPVNSSEFADWLRLLWRQETKAVASNAFIADVVNYCRGECMFTESRINARIRANSANNCYFIDLCNEKWEYLEISTDGYKLAADRQFLFVRSGSMLELPYPAAKTDEINWNRFFNLRSFRDLLLVRTWLVQAMMCDKECPILRITGEQGSGKSTIAKRLRNIIDPNAVPVMHEPHSPRDLAIALSNSRVLILDNLTEIRRWLSDFLCCVVTGGGFRTRALHSDKNESLFSFMAPIIITGIELQGCKPDLDSRTIAINVEEIAPERREARREQDAAFAQFYPQILASVLSDFVGVLRLLPKTNPEGVSRMGDYHLTGRALAHHLGMTEQYFDDCLSENRERLDATATEKFSIVPFLIEMAQSLDCKAMTASLLFSRLENLIGSERRPADWPRSPSQASMQLRLLSPILHSVKLEARFYIVRGARLIDLKIRKD